MTVVVQRLSEDLRPLLLAHFLSLPATDRRLRFGTALVPRMIAAYVERLDFGRDAVFGVLDDDLALAGVVHVALENQQAELGLSVLPAHRRRGVGGALFRRACEHARNRCISRLCMQYLSTNAAIMRMARSFDMDIVSFGVETAARLGLPEPSTTSIVGEFVTDTFAALDSTVKAFLAGWRYRRNAGGTA